MAIPDPIRPTRRALLAGVATLPAAPVLALPVLDDDDEAHTQDIIMAASAGGVSADLLYACTCDLDRDQRRAVLDRIVAFARKHAITVQWRGNSTREVLCSAFEEMAHIMERLARETGQTGWSVSGCNHPSGFFSFDVSIKEPIRSFDPVTGCNNVKDRYHLHLTYDDGLLTDETWRLRAASPDRVVAA